MATLTLDAIVAASARARAGGSLFSLDTQPTEVTVGGLKFVVRKVAALAKKEKAGAAGPQEFRNPFLPYEPSMYVGDVGSDHVCLLNKFNVVDNHILCVTKAFHHQCTALTPSDFAAWWQCVSVFPTATGFWNCGPLSGASQPHKHMQIVPQEAPLVDSLADGHPGDLDTIHTSPQLPFQHGYVCLPSHVTGTALASAYRRLAAALHIPLLEEADPNLLAQDIRQYPPGFVSHNALLTRRLLFLAPRSKEHSVGGGHSVSINALGYAGHILTRTEDQLRYVLDRGPLTCLTDVSVPV